MKQVPHRASIIFSSYQKTSLLVFFSSKSVHLVGIASAHIVPMLFLAQPMAQN
jgi:hypothetical protein